MRPDDDIKRDVEAELRWYPGLEASDVAVAVAQGVVSLSGFVRSHAEKLETMCWSRRELGALPDVKGRAVIA